MVRLGTVTFALLLAACSGEIQSDIYEDLDPKAQVALEKWVEKAYPVLGTKCVMCHDGSMPMIGYLAGTGDIERRDTLIAYMPAVINLSAPMSSRMLTKGSHTGPALEAKEASDILSWIVAEREARGTTTMVIRSDKITPMLCAANPCPINIIDLTSLGQAGTLEFEVTQLVSDLYLTNITLKAGAAGLHVTHPLIESWPAAATDPKPDPIDRWFNVDLNIAPNMQATVGTGEGSFTGFGAVDALSVRFDVFEMMKAM